MSEQSGDRNAEIWSTRVQRELLALTTDNAPEQDKKETQGVLPPFMTVKDHKLDIGAGTCVVSFTVEITGKRKKKPSSPAAATAEAEGNASSDEEKAVVTVTLDASLAKKSDGTLDTLAPAYPFIPPRVIVAEGASNFPEGSTIQDGDLVAIDCDWTPSLHLSDAVLNIGLKVKESILQQEPFHPAPELEKDPLEDIMSRASAIGDKLGRSLKNLGFKGGNDNKQKLKKKKNTKKGKPPTPPGEIRIGDEINLLEPPWVESQGIYSCKAVRRPEFVEAAIQHAALENGEQVSNSLASVVPPQLLWR
jgi:hypothetical protein